MRWSAETVVPAARSEGLVVERLGGETLVYDTERDQAHHLNPTAAVVFELCDGRATVGELAAIAAARLGQPVGAETVREALALLIERELLSQTPHSDAGVSRRQVVRHAALAGAGVVAAAPVIKSIVAPTPAHAQSSACIPQNGQCDFSSPNCCSGLVCCLIVSPSRCIPAVNCI
jgi:hypothetical protein